MTEKKAADGVHALGPQPMKARMDDESILARSAAAVDAMTKGMGAVEVKRSDGGEDIVMRHVDIRTGAMPTEVMDRLVHEGCRPRSLDEELERARRDDDGWIERWARQDNASRDEYVDDGLDDMGPNLTGALIGVATILLGLLAVGVIVVGTYGLIHTLVELMF